MPGLERFLAARGALVQVTVTGTRGSTPRGTGTWMLVADGDSYGTIGGGQLELRAIQAARRMLTGAVLHETLDLALGPEIGQCCGGRVDIALTRLEPAQRAGLLGAVRADRQARPHVLVFGAGHVGRALADCLALLPMTAVLIDSRAQELDRCTAPVTCRLTPLPEAEIRAAPSASAYVIMTHDHALDFQLAAEALGRADAAYVGMIGSASKRAQLRRVLAASGPGLDTDRLMCPIGDFGVSDKRPEVIAALVTAEVIAALSRLQTDMPAIG